jgi:serine phosphatase RsbU (regulator of sigma subunit)
MVRKAIALTMKLKKEIFNHPEVILQLKKHELRTENLINKFRFVIFAILAIGDTILWHIKGGLKFNMVLGIGSGTLVFFGVLFLIHKATLCNKKPKPWLKYLTIVFDFLIIFMAFMEFKDMLLLDIGLSRKEFMLISTILFIFFNLLSAFRIQKQVLFFSTFLALALNLILQNSFESNITILIYTSTFIVISGMFTFWFAGYIMRSLVSNYRLNTALDEIKQANEEINAQKDELSTQNEYLQEQRDRIAEQKKNITGSIEYASRIQNALLVQSEEVNTIFPDNFILYHPKDIVSGDFYWFKEVEVFTTKYKIATAVDCTGHGVPGAFMSMLGTSFLNEIVTEFYDSMDAATILNRLREEVKKSLHQSTKDGKVKDGMDMALIVMDYDKMELQYAGANNPLFIVRKTEDGYAETIEEYKADRMPIGVFIKEKASFTNHTIKMQHGDIVYMFSDGYIDQFGGEKGTKFMKKNFRNALLENKHLPLPQQKIILDQKLKTWMGEKYEQVDDITVIGLRI